jgi:hypothetical protein
VSTTTRKWVVVFVAVLLVGSLWFIEANVTRWLGAVVIAGGWLVVETRVGRGR